VTGEIVATIAVSEGHDEVGERINEKRMRRGKERSADEMESLREAS
jgi:hypothetical protein